MGGSITGLVLRHAGAFFRLPARSLPAVGLGDVRPLDREIARARGGSIAVALLLVTTFGATPLSAAWPECASTPDPIACGGVPPVDCGGELAFCEDLSVGTPTPDKFKTPYIPLDFPLTRVRGEFETSVLNGFGYDIWFPTVVRFDYDPDLVAPGSTFEVDVTLATYDSNRPDKEYLFALPGFDAGLRLQVLFWTPSKGFQYITAATWGHDFLLSAEYDFDDDHPPDLGGHRNSFNSDVDYPVPLPGWWQLIELLVELNYRFEHQMQDREIEGTATVSPSDVQVANAAQLLWDKNDETQTIGVTLPGDSCNDSLTLTLHSNFTYNNRGYLLKVLKFFPGTDIEFGLELSSRLKTWFFLLGQTPLGDELYFPNLWDAQRDFELTIPVTLRPDLHVVDLRLAWASHCGVQYPVLEVEVENRGCASVDQAFEIRFFGANHGITVEDLTVDAQNQPIPVGATRTFQTGPILLWDREFRVFVDSKDQIDEMKEDNNTGEVDLAERPTGEPGFRTRRDDGAWFDLDLPVGLEPGSAGLLTPYPDLCGDNTIGPLRVGDADPQTSGLQVRVDFSYVTEGSAATLVSPPGTPVAGDTYLVTLTGPPSSEFTYGIQGMSTQTVQVTWGDPAPVLDVTAPDSVVQSRNLDLAGTASDASAVECTVSSRDGGLLRRYGPYAITGGAFTCDDLSLVDGDNEITVTAWNADGVRAEWSQVVRRDSRWDTTDAVAPTIHFTSPEYSDQSPCTVHLSDATPLISAVVSDVDAATASLGIGVDPGSVSLSIDGGTIGTGVEFDEAGALRYEVPSPLSQGEHSVMIQAQDRNGNPATKTAVFCVDTVPPVISGVAVTPSMFEPRHAGATAFPGNYPSEAPTTVQVGGTTVTLTATAPNPPNVASEYWGETAAPGSSPRAVAIIRTLQYPPLPQRRLMLVSVEGFAPSASLVVSVNSVQLSGVQLQTDETGRGALFFDEAYGVVDPSITLSYTLDEEAAVSIAIYAGTGTPGQFDEEDYRYTAYHDAPDETTMKRTYSSAGAHQLSYDGRVISNRYDLDSGVHTFVLRATDRAGNTSTASTTFTVSHARFEVDADKSTIGFAAQSGCTPATGTLDLRDPLGGMIPNRVLRIRPSSDRNDFAQIPPDIDDVFFTGFPQGRDVIVPTTTAGQIRFPLQGLEPGTAMIELEYLSQGVTPTLIGSAAAVTTPGTLCSQSVSTTHSTVQVSDTPGTCEPFGIDVELRNGANQPLGDATVSLKVTSSRNQGATIVDYFFDRAGPQGGFTPVYAGSEVLPTIDSRGKLTIPVFAIQPGSATYTVHLRRGSQQLVLGTVDVTIGEACAEAPDPDQSTLAVSPSEIDPSGVATLTLALRDARGQAISHTSFAFEPTTDRNEAGTGLTPAPDVFGSAGGASGDSVLVETTDANGEIRIPVRSVEAGEAVISVTVFGSSADTVLPGGAASTLLIRDADGDEIGPLSSELQITPDSVQAGACGDGTLTLKKENGAPYRNRPFGVLIRSLRNDRPEAPWAVDRLSRGGCMSPGEELPEEVSVMITDDDGQIPFNVTSVEPGTAIVVAAVVSVDALVLVASDKISFGDTDADGVPDGVDLCTDHDDGQDCDADGLPDGCDAPAEDSDQDGWSDFCDNCPTAHNPDQLDSNLDGRGDACDPGCGDGVLDAGETCDGEFDALCPGACPPNGCHCPSPSVFPQLDGLVTLVQKPGFEDIHPYWDQAITGLGQMVSFHDTGFSLDAAPLADEYDQAGSAGAGHRKVEAYSAGPIGDLFSCDGPLEGAVGHGVVVAGAAIGSATRFVGDYGGNVWLIEDPHRGTPGVFDEAFDEGIDGVAPGARAFLWDMADACPDGPFPDPPFGGPATGFAEAVAAGATIHNLSIGSADNHYTAAASAVDQHQLSNDQSLAVVAAGADGGSPPGGLYDLANCKDCITVGAVERLLIPNGWAVLPEAPEGPADVGAPGIDVVAEGGNRSCKSDDADQSNPVVCIPSLYDVTGSSIAAAMVSGAAALARDYLAQGFHPDGTADDPGNDSTVVSDPSGQLIKAMLIASTDPVTIGPVGLKPVTGHRWNDLWGYGVVNLSNVLPLHTYPGSALGLVLHDGVRSSVTDTTLATGLFDSQSTAHDFAVAVDDPLAVVLTWADPVGPLVTNNLDLTLTYCGVDDDCDNASDNQEWFGNWFTEDRDRNGVLDPGEDLDLDDVIDQSYWSLPTDLGILNHDSTSSTEAIFIAEPPVGAYRVTVQAMNVVVDPPQRFALAVAGGVPRTSLIRWDRPRATCQDQLSILVVEVPDISDPACSSAMSCTPATIESRVRVWVYDEDDVLVEEETVSFGQRPGASLVFDSSLPLLTTLQETQVEGDGVLDCGDGYRYEARYQDSSGVVRATSIDVVCPADCDGDGVGPDLDCDNLDRDRWSCCDGPTLAVSDLRIAGDTLSWSAVSGAIEYGVRRSDDPRFTGGGSCLVDPVPTDTTAVDPQDPASLYCYLVGVVEECGFGVGPASAGAPPRQVAACP